jgi:hypothetical protein
MEWDKDLITLQPNVVTDQTILCWWKRGNHTLSGMNTRRARKQGGTRKNMGKSTESFIYLIARSGFNDILVQLGLCTEYAIHHKRSIILRFLTYSATDLSTVFDFSKYPVPIYTNYQEKLNELSNRRVEPPKYGKINADYSHSHIDKNPMRFDIHKSYPRETVLVYSMGINQSRLMSTRVISLGDIRKYSIDSMRHLKFTKDFLKMYNDFKAKYNIPAEYKAAHLRATDRKLSITNIHGISKEESKNILHGNDTMIKIDRFIHYKGELPTYIASDNTELLVDIIKKYPSVINTHPEERRDKCNGKRVCHSLHHPRGRTDPNNLKEAIIDLLILANAKILMATEGGYSVLAANLMKHRDILDGLLS